MSDFFILMRAWDYAAQHQFRLEACQRVGVHGLTARQVGPLFQQFLQIAQQEGLPVHSKPPREVALQKCILTGFSDRVARRLDEGTLRCELVHGRRGQLARESTVQRHPLFVAAEVREIEGPRNSVNTLLSMATAIEADWLRDLFPEEMQVRTAVYYDSTTKRVMAEERDQFRDLILASRRLDPPPQDEAARILAEEVLQGRLSLKLWNHGVDQWILRLNLLSRACPELALPAIEESDRRHLIEQICHGAVSYKDLKERPVKPVVKSWLSPAQQAFVEKEAPERVTLSNQRKPKVTYVADGSPYISLRIQELYDVNTTPCIAMGRMPLLVHILAPNMRAVQITQDMAGFWREHYPRAKKELQRRYPKHQWR